MTDGAWAGYKYFDFEGDEQEITIVVRGNATGIMKITTERGGMPVAAIRISPSENWTKFSGKIIIPSGVSPLYFTYEGKGAMDIKEFIIK